MNINLNELIEAKIISPETAGQISSFYEQRLGKSGNKMIIVFGILGALLVGSGIILAWAFAFAGCSIFVRVRLCKKTGQ